MTRPADIAIELRRMILRMGDLSEAILEKAIRSVRERNAGLAEQVEGEDLEIDRLDVALDEAVLRGLALQAPVAEDLRTIFAIKTMATDLERVGDLARNIAKAARRLASRPRTNLVARLEPLERAAQGMLQRALESFRANDPETARRVIASDDAVDDLQAELTTQLISELERSPDYAAQIVDLILIAENAERIADHATNIAEDVILVAEARNVKHAEKLGRAGGNAPRG